MEWKPEMEKDFDNFENMDDAPMRKTGWIVGVVEYAGCGSHEAKWKSEADFNLALAAPELYGALKRVMGNICQAHGVPGNVEEIVKQAISKAEGRV